MKSETEILGELDALLAQLPDDAARDRAFTWLRAKHQAKPAVPAQPTLVTFQPAPVPPYPFIIHPPPVIERDPYWLGTLEITCAGNTTGGASLPAAITGETVGFMVGNTACAPTQLADWTWVGETRLEPPASGFRPSGMHS